MSNNGRRRGQVIPVKGKKNTWMVRTVADYDPATGDRKLYNKVVHGTKRDAEAHLAEVQSKIDRGQYLEPTKMTLNELLDLWLRHKQGTVRSSTYKGYEDKLKLYVRPVLGTRRLDKVTAAQVLDLYASMREKYSPRTIRYVHVTLKAALAHAVNLGFITKSPLDGLRVPLGIRQAGKSFTEDQANRFMRLAMEGDRWDHALAFALATAMRPSEYLALRWADVDLVKGTASVQQTVTRRSKGWVFEVPKTDKSRRTIELPKSILPMLRKRLRQFREEKLAAGPEWHDLDLVFCTAIGTPGNVNNLRSRNFISLLKAAKIPDSFRLYDLRHTCATLLLQRGVHIKVVSERLGHKDIAMTLRTYAHVLPSMQQDAVMKLDDLLFGS